MRRSALHVIPRRLQTSGMSPKRSPAKVDSVQGHLQWSEFFPSLPCEEWVSWPKPVQLQTRICWQWILLWKGLWLWWDTRWSTELHRKVVVLALPELFNTVHRRQCKADNCIDKPNSSQVKRKLIQNRIHFLRWMWIKTGKEMIVTLIWTMMAYSSNQILNAQG